MSHFQWKRSFTSKWTAFSYEFAPKHENTHSSLTPLLTGTRSCPFPVSSHRLARRVPSPGNTSKAALVKNQTPTYTSTEGDTVAPHHHMLTRSPCAIIPVAGSWEGSPLLPSSQRPKPIWALISTTTITKHQWLWPDPHLVLITLRVHRRPPT